MQSMFHNKTFYLIIARKPPEEDPAVIAQDLPRPIKEGEEVLARWSDDGWYYRGTEQYF